MGDSPPGGEDEIDWSPMGIFLWLTRRVEQWIPHFESSLPKDAFLNP